MNSIQLIGRITKEIEMKTSSNKNTFAPFTLAVKRKKEGTDFISCLAFGKTAELITSYCKKGHLLGINGHLEINSKKEKDIWTTSANVIVEEITFIESKEQNKQQEQEEIMQKINQNFITKEEAENKSFTEQLLDDAVYVKPNQSIVLLEEEPEKETKQPKNDINAFLDNEFEQELEKIKNKAKEPAKEPNNQEQQEVKLEFDAWLNEMME